MSREQVLEQALEHIILTVKGSRTNTRRLARIQKRAEVALQGLDWDEEKYKIPVKQAKTPVEYEMQIRFLKRDLEEVLNMGWWERVLFLFKIKD